MTKLAAHTKKIWVVVLSFILALSITVIPTHFLDAKEGAEKETLPILSNEQSVDVVDMSAITQIDIGEDQVDVEPIGDAEVNDINRAEATDDTKITSKVDNETESSVEFDIGLQVESEAKPEIRVEEVKPEVEIETETEAEAEVEAVALAPFDSGVVVTTFGELRDAIRASDVDTIFLGNDITLTASIDIPTTKSNLTIDGQGVYTLDQGRAFIFNSFLGSSATYTFQNMYIEGRNLLGVVYCAPATTGHNIILRDIHYTGPQLVYNRYGTMTFEGTNSIVITKNGETSHVASEVAEVHGVSVSGNLTIVSYSTLDSFFWMFPTVKSGVVTQPYFTVESNASVEISTGVNKIDRGFFWTEGVDASIDFTVKPFASCIIDITGYNPFSSTVAHRLRSMTIMEEAYVVINAGGGIVIANTLEVQKGAVLKTTYLARPDTGLAMSASPLLHFPKTTNLATPAIKIDKAKAVVFAVEPTNRAMFQFAAANSIHMVTTDFNYWNSFQSAASSQKPTKMWNSDANNEFIATMKMKVGADAISSLTGGTADFENSFNPALARVIQVGTDAMYLSPDKIESSIAQVSGSTDPSASVYADFAMPNNQYRSYAGISGNNGRFTIQIDDGTIDSSTSAVFTSVKDFIAIAKKVLLQESEAPTGTPITQIIMQGDPFPIDGSSLVSDIRSGFPGDVEISIVDIPDTRIYGSANATVELTNAAGKSTQIVVPVFVMDEHTSINEEKTLALRAESFKLQTSEYPADEVDAFVLSRSLAQAWNIVTGIEVSPEIVVADNQMINKPGIYSIDLAISDLVRPITATVEEVNDWINVRMPVKMLFGSIDEYEDGSLVAPIYEMQNYSDYPVEISLLTFDIKEDAGITLLQSSSDSADGQLLQLGLTIAGVNVIDYLYPEFRVTDESKALALLAPSQTEKLSLFGTFYGEYPKDRPLRPEYVTTWSFKAS